jgi:dihydroxyacetone kinase
LIEARRVLIGAFVTALTGPGAHVSVARA